MESKDDHFSTRHDDGSCTCGGCKARVRAKGPDAIGLASAAAGFGMVFMALPLVAVMPPLNMMLIPPTFFIVASLVGYGAEAVLAEPRCPECERYLVFKPAGA